MQLTQKLLQNFLQNLREKGLEGVDKPEYFVYNDVTQEERLLSDRLETSNVRR